MAKPALGILAGILIFIAAGCLAAFWIAKMRQEREQRKPRIAYTHVCRQGSVG
jgi:hypothetical protein